MILWCWGRLLRVPWTARRSNQSILKEISPEYSLEGLMLKLKLQYFGHLMRRTDPFEKTLMLERSKAGGEGNDRGWDGWMASLTQWTWVWVNSRSWWWTGKPDVLQSIGSQSRTWLSDWTELCELSFHDFYLFNSGLLVFSSLDCQVHVLKISSSKLWFAFNSLSVYSWWIKVSNLLKSNSLVFKKSFPIPRR